MRKCRKRKCEEDDIERRNRPKEELEKQDDDDDRISELADEILISIISRLPLKEATSTSILSTRWRYLHTYTSRLHFPPFQPQHNLQQIENTMMRFRNHLNMINGVMDSHRGGRLVKELKLHIMDMDGAGIEFDKWIKFALSREIEIIDIKLHDFPYPRSYNLGLPKLVSSTNSGHPLPAFKCLNQLRLDLVDVNDQDFELLISKFLLLETLSIQHSNELRNVSIVGHPKLKHLDISYAFCLESFEIRKVINLVSLQCYLLPSTCALNFGDVPNLVRFMAGTHFYSLPLFELFNKTPSCIRDQLQELHLFLQFIMMDPMELPFNFANVKHLVLEVDSLDELASVFLLHPWIHACPSLEKLEIKFVWREEDEFFQEKEAKILASDEKFSPNLKEVEITGFLGHRLELTVSQFIISNAMTLEELIVVACDISPSIRLAALARAQRHFRRVTPPSVNLQIL